MLTAVVTCAWLVHSLMLLLSSFISAASRFCVVTPVRWLSELLSISDLAEHLSHKTA